MAILLIVMIEDIGIYKYIDVPLKDRTNTTVPINDTYPDNSTAMTNDT
jgi:hypothetical protein